MPNEQLLALVDELNFARAEVKTLQDQVSDYEREVTRLAPFEYQLEEAKEASKSLEADLAEQSAVISQYTKDLEASAKALKAAEKKQAKSDADAFEQTARAKEAEQALTEAKARIEELEGIVRTQDAELDVARPVVAASESLKAALAKIG